jgi:hypothetical protein
VHKLTSCLSHFLPKIHQSKIKSSAVVIREEVETRKIGRNETWTFLELFPGCTEVDEKPGEKHDIIVSFLMKRAWMAE